MIDFLLSNKPFIPGINSTGFHVFSFNILVNSVSPYFVKAFYICHCEVCWSVVLKFLSGFGIRLIILASWYDLHRVPCSYIFWRETEENWYYSFLKCLLNKIYHWSYLGLDFLGLGEDFTYESIVVIRYRSDQIFLFFLGSI